MAFTFGLTRSICCKCAERTSVAEILWERICCDISTAFSRQIEDIAVQDSRVVQIHHNGAFRPRNSVGKLFIFKMLNVGNLGALTCNYEALLVYCSKPVGNREPYLRANAGWMEANRRPSSKSSGR